MTKKAFREVAQEIRWAAESDHSAPWEIKEIERVIKAGEKQHRSHKPDDVSMAPISHAVDYFLVQCIASALETIGKRKSLPVASLTVRDDYFLALRFVARHRQRLVEHRKPGLISRILKAAKNSDYCEDISNQ